VIYQARHKSNCTSKLQTHALVREGSQRQENLSCQTENKNLVLGSRWETNTKTTGLLTVGRNLTSSSKVYTSCSDSFILAFVGYHGNAINKPLLSKDVRRIALMWEVPTLIICNIFVIATNKKADSTMIQYYYHLNYMLVFDYEFKLLNTRMSLEGQDLDLSKLVE
jgi:hypothetical protein